MFPETFLRRICLFIFPLFIAHRVYIANEGRQPERLVCESTGLHPALESRLPRRTLALNPSRDGRTRFAASSPLYAPCDSDANVYLRRFFVALKYRLSSSVYTQQRLFLSSRARTSWHGKSYAVLENNRYERKRMNRNLLRDIERRTRTWNSKNVLREIGYYAFPIIRCVGIIRSSTTYAQKWERGCIRTANTNKNDSVRRRARE